MNAYQQPVTNELSMAIEVGETASIDELDHAIDILRTHLLVEENDESADPFHAAALRRVISLLEERTEYIQDTLGHSVEERGKDAQYYTAKVNEYVNTANKCLAGIYSCGQDERDKRMALHELRDKALRRASYNRVRLHEALGIDKIAR